VNLLKFLKDFDYLNKIVYKFVKNNKYYEYKKNNVKKET